MSIVSMILEGIMALLKAIPIFNKWFSKSPTQKVEDAKADIAQEIEDFKKTGRPPQ